MLGLEQHSGQLEPDARAGPGDENGIRPIFASAMPKSTPEQSQNGLGAVPNAREEGHQPLERSARWQNLQLRQGWRVVELCSEVWFGLGHDRRVSRPLWRAAANGRPVTTTPRSRARQGKASPR